MDNSFFVSEEEIRYFNELIFSALGIPEDLIYDSNSFALQYADFLREYPIEYPQKKEEKFVRHLDF